TLMMFAGPMAMNLQGVLRGIIANSYQIRADGPGLLDLAHSVVWRIIGALGVPFVLLTIAALGGSAIQHRILFSVDPLMPSLSKISLGAGIKRLFSVQAVANFAKGLVKLIAIGGVMAALLWPQRQRLVALVDADPVAILPFARAL